MRAALLIYVVRPVPTGDWQAQGGFDVFLCQQQMAGPSLSDAGAAFVAVFTVYPLVQMVWVSFNNWSLISRRNLSGFNNFIKAFNDRQFWISLAFTLKYTLSSPRS